MRKPRILHIGKFYPPVRGGIETALADLADAGVALGYEVRVEVAAQVRQSPTVETRGGITVTRHRTWTTLLSTPITPTLVLDSPRPEDVLHLHLPQPLAEAATLLRLAFSPALSRKFAPYLHAVPVSQGWLGRLWFRRVTLPLLRRAKLILVSNPSFTSFTSLFSDLKPLEPKLRILPFQAPAAPTKALGARERKAFILAVGRLVPYKGFDVLLQAIAKIRATTPALSAFRVLIGGQGPEYHRLGELCRHLGLFEGVEFIGDISDETKLELMRTCSVFAAPSTTTAETFGISILEAMSQGAPVATTRLPTGVAWLARGGDCGAVATPGSATEFATALTDLLLNEPRRDEASNGNLNFVRQEFSQDALHRRYEKILRELDEGTE